MHLNIGGETVIPEGLMVSIFFQYNSSPSHKIKSNEEKIEASYVLAGFYVLKPMVKGWDLGS